MIRGLAWGAVVVSLMLAVVSLIAPQPVTRLPDGLEAAAPAGAGADVAAVAPPPAGEAVQHPAGAEPAPEERGPPAAPVAGPGMEAVAAAPGPDAGGGPPAAGAPAAPAPVSPPAEEAAAPAPADAGALPGGGLPDTGPPAPELAAAETSAGPPGQAPGAAPAPGVPPAGPVAPLPGAPGSLPSPAGAPPETGGTPDAPPGAPPESPPVAAGDRGAPPPPPAPGTEVAAATPPAPAVPVDGVGAGIPADDAVPALPPPPTPPVLARSGGPADAEVGVSLAETASAAAPPAGAGQGPGDLGSEPLVEGGPGKVLPAPAPPGMPVPPRAGAIVPGSADAPPDAGAGPQRPRVAEAAGATAPPPPGQPAPAPVPVAPGAPILAADRPLPPARPAIDPPVPAEGPPPEAAPPPGPAVEGDTPPPAAAPGRRVPPGVRMPPDSALPGPEGTDAGLPSARMPGKPVPRLPGLGPHDPRHAPDADAAPAAEAVPGVPALERYAAESPPPDGRPRLAVVLIDDGSADLDPAQLAALPFRLAFAIDAEHPHAAEAMRRYRDAGQEVVVMARLPQRATPADAAVAVADALAAVPEAVAVMEPEPGALQPDRPVARQVVQMLEPGGQGLLTWAGGLDPAARFASEAGVAQADLLRVIDPPGDDARAIGRQIDQAALRAGQQPGGAVLVGHARAATIAALSAWLSTPRAQGLSLVPVSAVLAGGGS